MVTEKWYTETIEEPVRELVHILRNNGFNTECSCGHEMYIQCQYIPEGQLMELHNLIFNYLVANNEALNYDIDIKIKVREGHMYPSLDINLRPVTN